MNNGQEPVRLGPLPASIGQARAPELWQVGDRYVRVSYVAHHEDPSLWEAWAAPCDERGHFRGEDMRRLGVARFTPDEQGAGTIYAALREFSI